MLVEKNYKEGDIVTLIIAGLPETIGKFVSETQDSITLNGAAHLVPSHKSEEKSYDFIPVSITGQSNEDVSFNKSHIISSMNSWQGHADNYIAVIEKAKLELKNLEQED